MSEKIMSLALASARDAELFMSKVEEYPVIFEANKLSAVKSKLLQGYSLRIIKDGRLGFASDTELRDPAALIERAVESSKYGPRVKFNFWKGKRFPNPVVFHPRIVSFEMEEAEQLGQRIINRLRDLIPSVYVDVRLTRVFKETSLLTRGGEKVYYKSIFHLLISALLVREGEFLYINESKSSCNFPENPFGLVGEIAWKEKMCQKTVELPSHKLPVIFTPKVVPELLGAFTTGLNGRTIVSKSSPLTDRTGEQILDERFTLYDDGLMESGLMSAPFDDEGVPRQRFALFEHGVLKNYILDLSTSSALQTESTASAARTLLMPPSPASSNLQVQPGDMSYEEMLDDIEEGLVVDQVIGGGQSNLLGGEFSMNVELGFYVKKGKIVGRVRNTMVAGNVYDLFKNQLIAIGREASYEDGVLTPHLYFKDVCVSGKA
jgi:PmbA protein